MALRKRQVNVTRDTILFGFGLSGIVYETILSHTDRPTLLVLFGACIGLPVFLRTDEKSTVKLDEAGAIEAAAKAELQRVLDLEEELAVAKARAQVRAAAKTAQTPPPPTPTRQEPLEPEADMS